MNDKENIEGLFATNGCLTLDTMKRFNASFLSFEEKNLVQKHLDECALCRDALEGLSLVSDPEKLDSVVAEINKNLKSVLINEKTARTIRPNNRIYYIAAAASVLIFIGIFSWIRFSLQKQNMEMTSITEKSPADISGYSKDTTSDLLTETPAIEISDGAKVSPSSENEDKEIKSSERKSHPVHIVEEYTDVLEEMQIDKDADDQEIIVTEEVKTMDQSIAIAKTNETPPENVIGGIKSGASTMAAEGSSKNAGESVYEIQYDATATGFQPSAAKKSRSKDSDVFEADTNKKTDFPQEEHMNNYVVVENQPEFPGGPEALKKYIEKNLIYPDSAKVKGIQGKVFVSFIVEETGKISDPKIQRGLGGGCDEEALRLLESMPNWIPGKQGGKPVNVQFVLPVEFKLDD